MVLKASEVNKSGVVFYGERSHYLPYANIDIKCHN